MSANERRAEIMRIMVARRQENMQVLAAELGDGISNLGIGHREVGKYGL